MNIDRLKSLGWRCSIELEQTLTLDVRDLLITKITLEAKNALRYDNSYWCQLPCC